MPSLCKIPAGISVLLSSMALLFALALLGQGVQPAFAGTSTQKLIVNTESFERIDSGDGSTNRELQFGSSGTVLFYRTASSRFEFTKPLWVQGAITATGSITTTQILSGATVHASTQLRSSGSLNVEGNSYLDDSFFVQASSNSVAVGAGRQGVTPKATLEVGGTVSGAQLRVSNAGAEIDGTLTASGTARFDDNLTLNDDRTTAADAVLTFGNQTANQTLKFIHATQKFQFSTSLDVQGTMSGRSLMVSGTGSVPLLQTNLPFGSVGVGVNNSLRKLEVQSLSGTSLAEGAVSFNNMLFSQLEGGAYFGRTGVKENQWGTANYWKTSVARDSNRIWMNVAMSSDGKIQAATSSGGQIYTSSGYGLLWAARDSNRKWQGIAMSSDGKIQTATASGGQVYTSPDYGITWTARDSSRKWRGVGMSSDGKIQTAVVTAGQIYTSKNYGMTWAPKDSNRTWVNVAMSSDGKLQTATASGGQIYTSADYGNTWTARDSSRKWQGIAMSSDGKIQTASVLAGQIYVSTDYGVTWTAKDSNRIWFNVALSGDGKLQTATASGGQIYTSPDYGSTWTAMDSSRKWQGVAMSADGKVQTAVVSNGQIYTSYADSTTVGNIAVSSTVSGSLLRAQATLASSGALVLKNRIGTATGNILTVDTTGLVYDATNKRVGVGTSTPKAKLDIAGTMSGSQVTVNRVSAGSGQVFISGSKGGQLCLKDRAGTAYTVCAVTTGVLTCRVALAAECTQ